MTPEPSWPRKREALWACLAAALAVWLALAGPVQLRECITDTECEQTQNASGANHRGNYSSDRN